MKTMKRIVVALLVVGMMLTAVACGAEQTVTMRADLSESGMAMTDTMVLNAKGDTVQELKEIMVLDLSTYDDETKDYLISFLNASYVVPAQAINGVTCTDSTTDSSYTIELTIDCTNSDAIKEAANADILDVSDTNAGRISLKATQSGLEAAGYKVVE